MDDGIGIYEEARRRTEYYAAQNESLRRRILGLGPTNGAWAETVNPFEPKPRLPIQSKPPFWKLHGQTRIRRRLHTLRDDLDVNPLQIVQAVCSIAHLSAGKLLGRGNQQQFSWPRQVAIYFIARYCGELSLSQIAYIFTRDHTTVMYSIRAVPRRIDMGCERTRALVDEVEAQLRLIK